MQVQRYLFFVNQTTFSPTIRHKKVYFVPFTCYKSPITRRLSLTIVLFKNII